MHTTSSPQSLLSMFSALPTTQAPPELEGAGLDEGQAFSSILNTMLPTQVSQSALASKLQALPQIDQVLPPAAGQNSLALIEASDLAMDFVLGQLSFGEIGLVPVNPATNTLPVVDDASIAEESLLERELASELVPDSANPVLNFAQMQAAPVEVDSKTMNADMLTSAAQEMAKRLQGQDLMPLAKNAVADTLNTELESASTVTDAAVNAALESETGEFYLPAAQSTRMDNAAVTLQAPVEGVQVNSAQASALASLQAMSESAGDAPELTSQLKESLNQSETLQTQLRRERLEFGADRSEWGGALGSRIVTMIADDIQQARIHLDPPELGSLEIKLQVQQDQATVQVHAQNPQVREILESHAQRLRDALASQGIQLSGFDVSERGQEETGHEQQSEGSSESGEWLVADESSELEHAPRATLNLLDTFA